MGNGATQATPAPSNALVPAARQPAAPSVPSATPPKRVQLQEVKDAILQQSAVDNGLRRLLKDPGPIQRKQVIDLAVSLVAKRVMTPQAMAGYLADIPEDPLQIRKWAAAHAKDVEKDLDQLLTLLHGAAAPPAQSRMQ
jgi:hypothetical protein